MRRAVLLALVAFGALVCGDSGVASPSRYAYVTLIYDKSFLSAVRVLAASVRATGTQYPFEVLVTSDIENDFREPLEADGARVRVVEKIKNPHVHHPSFQKRLLYVFTKLNLFRMIDYDRIVYLDADTLVVKPIDEMFECGDVCASPRDAFFNAGVLVLSPRAELFDDLVSKRTQLTSYNGGEQGFLNNYFNRYGDSVQFTPKATAPLADTGDCRGKYASGKPVRCQKMSPSYNGDIGMYYIRNRVWWLSKDTSAAQEGHQSPHVIHYTLGPTKPWLWWTYPLFELNFLWYSVFTSLPRSSYFHGAFFVHALCLAVPLALLYALLHMLAPFRSTANFLSTRTPFIKPLSSRVPSVPARVNQVALALLSCFCVFVSGQIAYSITNSLCGSLIYAPLVTYLVLMLFTLLCDVLFHLTLFATIRRVSRQKTSSGSDIESRRRLIMESSLQYALLYVTLLAVSYLEMCQPLKIKVGLLVVVMLLLLVWRTLFVDRMRKLWVAEAPTAAQSDML